MVFSCFRELTMKKTEMKSKKKPIKRVREGNQIQASSLEEVKDGIYRATGRLRKSLKIPGEAFTVGKLIEAFIVYCLTRPHDDQETMARQGQMIVERLRLLKEAGPAVDWEGSSSSEKPSGTRFTGVEDGAAGKRGRVPPIKSLGSQIDCGAIRWAECSEVDA